MGRLCIETTALVLLTTFCYFVSDFRIAFFTFLWTMAQLIGSQWMVAAHEDLFAVKINGAIFRLYDLALFFHIVGWVAQFIGHGVFEKRAPALMTNLFFAGLAPFFTSFEILNGMLGYKEGKELDEIRRRI